MECVRTVKYMVKCNSRLIEAVVPSKGLRQKNPLSPYLFLFCMDALSRLLLKAQDDGIMRGLRVCYNCPRINHLFFTDDVLLFIRNKIEDVENVKEIFIEF